MITLSTARARELGLLRTGQRRQNPEYELQCAFVHWLDTVAIPKWPELAFGFAVPNVRRSKGDAIKRWKEGARSGPADYIFLLPRGGCFGLVLEFKAPKTGRVSPAQHAWLSGVGMAGFYAITPRTLEQATDAVARYMSYSALYPEGPMRVAAQALLDARGAATQKRKRQRRRG